MNSVALATFQGKPIPAVDYFYTATFRRSRDTTWPIFAPALTPLPMDSSILTRLACSIVRFLTGPLLRQHSVFRMNRDAAGGQGMTQFGRALAELKIEMPWRRIVPAHLGEYK